jgi:hypothetical protein
MEIQNLKTDLNAFRAPILEENNENFNYDDGINVNYHNIPLFYDRTPFSGTVVEFGEDYATLTEYEDGILNGKYMAFDEKGERTFQGIYEEGFMAEGTSWYENGQLEQMWDKTQAKGWYEEGSLEYEGKNPYKNWIYRFREEYYYFQNGNLKIRILHTTNGINTAYFLKDGTQICDWQGGKNSIYAFEHELLLARYTEILTEKAEEKASNFWGNADNLENIYGTKQNRIDFLWKWFIRFLNINEEKAIDVAKHLFSFPDKEIAQMFEKNCAERQKLLMKYPPQENSKSIAFFEKYLEIKESLTMDENKQN